MEREHFDSLMAGLEQDAEYARGDKSRCQEAANEFLRDTVQEQYTEEELTAAYDRGMQQIQEGKFVAVAWEDLERAANG